MFQSLVPINRETHAKTRIKPIQSFDFAKSFHMGSVMVHEFARSASVYPIVFLENKEKDEFQPVALFGLEAGENLFIDAQGGWKAAYIPAIIRRYPFALARLPDTEDQFTVCLDEASPVLNTDEGDLLFTDTGEPTAIIENVKRYLSEMQQMEVFTSEFCRFIAAHNLFSPLNMRVRYGDKIRQITGCYSINEERLNNLSDALFLEIRHKQYLTPVFTHLTSLSQLERLAQLKDGHNAISSPAEAATEQPNGAGIQAAT